MKSKEYLIIWWFVMPPLYMSNHWLGTIGCYSGVLRSYGADRINPLFGRKRERERK